MGKHTPEPWPELIEMPPRADIPEARDYPTESCGSVLLNASNYARAKACVDALAGIPDPAAYIKAMQSLTGACENLRNEWTAKHVANTPLDYAVVEVILAVSDALRTLSTPESEVKRGSSQAALDNSKKEASDGN